MRNGEKHMLDPRLTDKELHRLGSIAGTERLGRDDGHLLIRLLREHKAMREKTRMFG